MKVLAFQSLEEANEYITKELGLPPIPEGALPPGTVAEHETDTMRVRVHAAESGPTINGFEDLLETVLGSDEAEGEAQSPEPEMMPVPEFNAFYELTAAQTTRLMTERNIAEQTAQAEREAHIQCHEGFEEALKNARISGYAEAVAAGIWPNQLFETLDEEHQDILMRQAEAAIDKLDEQRQLLLDEG